MSRPDAYSQAAADAICGLLTERWTVRQIAAREDMPAERTIYQWLEKHEEFAQQYARAKGFQADSFAEEIIEISDDGTNDWMDRQVGEDETIRVVDHEHIQRSKLRVDSRKWLMAKMAPKKYGERTEHQHTGADGKDLIPPSQDPGKVALAILSVLHAAKNGE